jgi:ATPase subunit of ABC transporter with duplicated ATPase domains
LDKVFQVVSKATVILRDLQIAKENLARYEEQMALYSRTVADEKAKAQDALEALQEFADEFVALYVPDYVPAKPVEEKPAEG